MEVKRCCNGPRKPLTSVYWLSIKVVRLPDPLDIFRSIMSLCRSGVSSVWQRQRFRELDYYISNNQPFSLNHWTEPNFWWAENWDCTIDKMKFIISIYNHLFLSPFFVPKRSPAPGRAMADGIGRMPWLGPAIASAKKAFHKELPNRAWTRRRFSLESFPSEIIENCFLFLKLVSVCMQFSSAHNQVRRSVRL